MLVWTSVRRFRRLVEPLCAVFLQLSTAHSSDRPHQIIEPYATIFWGDWALPKDIPSSEYFHIPYNLYKLRGNDDNQPLQLVH